MGHFNSRMIDKLGSCQDCTILLFALFGSSLLLMGLGGITDLTIVLGIGMLASAAFGLLLSLHALFFLLKRKKLVVEKPHRGCCGS
jgi:hypothetical protein